MKINSKTKICIIIGDPVEHSLSPQMHNGGYEALGIDNEFVFIAAKVKEENLSDFVKGARAMGMRGITCTIPHKTQILKYLDEIDDTAKKIGAVNTVVNTDGVLKGYNTDWIGVVEVLEKTTSLKGKKVALLGAGGAARAAAYGVTQRGAELAVFNRSVEKGLELAREFGGKYYSLESVQEVKNMDIIFNATSLGLEDKNETPIDKKFITEKHIVFDAIYIPYETRLLREAKEKGAKIIHGTEMLLYQGLEQFRLYTGRQAPEEEMRKVLLEKV